MACRKQFFLLVGPSGVGKTTLAKAMIHRIPALYYPPSYTTRDMRPDEKNGVDNFFVSQQRFMELLKAKELLEWDKPHEEQMYGIPANPVQSLLDKGQSVIHEVGFRGLEQILQTPVAPYVYSVFLGPTSFKDLEARLTKRGEEYKIKRLERAKLEMGYANQCNDQLIIKQGDIQGACDRLEKLIRHHMLSLMR